MVSQPARESEEPEEAGRKPARKRRVFLRLASVAGLVIVLMVAAGLAGFMVFIDNVSAIREPAPTIKGDAIVVLTGGQKRIESALDLLRRGAAPRLLISGVNPVTTGGEIRRLTRSSKALFACCVDIGHDAIDTIGNAYETARWIGSHNYKRVFLVTNDYHMPRSLMELRRVDPDTDFIPYPVVNDDLDRSDWLTHSEVVRRLFFEYVKYALARTRNLVGATTGTGLRTERAGTAGSRLANHTH